jgi:hypothetical protein
MDDETAYMLRFALAEGFGPGFANSELAEKLCAFTERYGLESVLEILEEAEGDLLLPTSPAESNRLR